MNEKGFSLIEMLIVLALAGLIVGIAVPLGLQVVHRSRAENEMQSLYANIAEARQRAVQNGRNFLLSVNDKSLTIYEDQDGDLIADVNEVVLPLSADGFAYPLKGVVGATAINVTPEQATISRRGFIDPGITIFVDQDARVNCIQINFTRIGMGKYDTSASTCAVQ